jgi:hypothetical protein
MSFRHINAMACLDQTMASQSDALSWSNRSSDHHHRSVNHGHQCESNVNDKLPDDGLAATRATSSRAAQRPYSRPCSELPGSTQAVLDLCFGELFAAAGFDPLPLDEAEGFLPRFDLA